MCILGGYKIQTVTQIANLLHAYDAGAISVRALRVYFAALCAVASREAATRSRAKSNKKGGLTPRFTLSELSRLTQLPLTSVSRELRALSQEGLLSFSVSEIVFTETALDGSSDLCEALCGGRSQARPVPLPRPVLRFLARCRKSSLLLTMLCYCVRGLTIARRGGEVTGKGSVKASWIADICGLSLRAVRSGMSAWERPGALIRPGPRASASWPAPRCR